jgi:hypothetical protein
MKRAVTLFWVAVLFLGIYVLKSRIAHAADQAIHGPYTVAERLQQYGAIVAGRLAQDFARAGVAYPPTRMTLVILKQEKQMQLYAGSANGGERFIHTFPILAASGHAGPKLREGDWQVPEGIYGVESLNPNSTYHLALHVNYPNSFDRQHAQADGRTQLGGDIMIHGSNVSIGCVALGDSAAEDIFVLAAKVGLPRVLLLFCPMDLRTAHPVSVNVESPPWTSELYAKLQAELKNLPAPATSNGNLPE